MKFNWKSINEKLTGLTLFTSLFAGVVGGLFSLNEYREGIKAERIKSTLEYVTKYSTGEVSVSNQRLFEMWERDYSILEAALDANQDNPTELEHAYRVTSLSIIKENRVGKDIDVLIGFFTSLIHCVHAKICDERTANTFFNSDMERFAKLHLSYIDYLRATWDKDIGKEIENYLKSRKELPE
ncbi:hypothetical protein EHQ13_04670 [Leptospira gomenensis]|uniref:DUF4760 domain-containing protein n=1 Tax=Leptospira gomenensis TaxID=2484974 RepID=A0A5F1Y597_9LEPT|nr:hypothetical protein EHQ17_19465 [Leptospira gomenensis]TGK42630.1 hypothetical protein EHQ07_14565 [Leptospira gomenensis]TGK65793.1 hypothetical protein EHQ13_04670 [Leptospira gomenensis]